MTDCTRTKANKSSDKGHPWRELKVILKSFEKLFIARTITIRFIYNALITELNLQAKPKTQNSTEM